MNIKTYWINILELLVIFHYDNFTWCYHNTFILCKLKINMVLQYKLKKSVRWKDYKGKDKLKLSVGKYDFRLLSENRKKILAEKGSYKKVMKRFRQIEFFKNR